METRLSDSYLSLASQLNLKENDILFIASDVMQLARDAKSAGERFDASAFIESFQEVLKYGTILIPAYTDHLKNGDSFDHAKAKPTTGALSNKVSRRKDFIRTKDPLHSVYVWGSHQDELSNLDGPSSLGKGSIFEWLYENDARMICIDVAFQNSLTFVHYVEEINQVKYRRPYHWNIERVFKDHSDKKAILFYSRQPWVLTDLELLQKSSLEAEVDLIYRLNQSEIHAFKLREMHDHIQGMLVRGEKLYRVSLLHFAKSIARKILGRA